MKNYSLFIIGIMMLVFAAMFHVYRYGRARAKAPPPRPVPPTPTKPATLPTSAKPAPATTSGEAQKPMVSSPNVTTRVSSEQMAQLAQQQQQQQQQKHTTSGGLEGAGKTGPTHDQAQATSAASGVNQDKKAL